MGMDLTPWQDCSLAEQIKRDQEVAKNDPTGKIITFSHKRQWIGYWQIGPAPKDGSKILAIFDMDKPFPMMVSWHDPKGWYNNDDLLDYGEPTYWAIINLPNKNYKKPNPQYYQNVMEDTHVMCLKWVERLDALSDKKE